MTWRLLVAGIPRSVWILVAAGVWFGYLWSLAWERDGRLTIVEIIAFWDLLVITVIVGRFWVHATPFEMALPLAPRQLWGARVLRLWIGAAVVGGCTVLTAMVWSSADVEILTAGAHVLAGFTLLIALISTLSPRLHAAPVNWMLVALSALAVGATLTFTIYTVDQPAAAAVAPLGAAALIFARTYYLLPATYRQVPDRPLQAVKPRTVPAARPQWPGPVWWMIFRIIYRPEWLAVLVMLFLLGFMPRSGQFTFLALIMVPVLLLPVLAKMPKLSHLPISRGLLFGFASLPAVVAWAAGSLAGRIWWGPGDTSVLLVHQPAGPETLTWLRFGLDAHTTPIVFGLYSVFWAAGLSLGLLRGHTRLDLREAAVARGVGSAAYSAVLLFFLWALSDVSPWAPGFHEWLRFQTASWIQTIAELSPVPAMSWIAAAVLAYGLYRWIEAGFRRVDAVSIPEIEP